jgi:hypothetical protein
MHIELPEPVAAYFAADKSGGAAVVRCFTSTAVVKDEGRTHVGPSAIEQWKNDAASKYRYTVEPLTCEQKDGATVVTSQVTGNFPGSPVTLRFCFRLERGKIASLEIAP